jgi:Uncharacterised protein family (UPF0158)
MSEASGPVDLKRVLCEERRMRVVAVIVQIQAVMEAIDLPEEMEAFLDLETGEVLVMTDEERDLLEEGNSREEEALEMPDWEKKSIGKLREILKSGRALALPAKFDFHEWDVMKRFAALVEDPDESIALLEAIHGTGAFRMFRETTTRLGLREAWFEYRDQALREMAKEWLEQHGVQYAEEGSGST